MDNKPSVAIIMNGLFVGGAEKFGISLANKFVSSGVSTHIFLFKKFDSPLFDLIDKRIEIIYIPRKSKYDLFLHKKFDAEINKRKINKVIYFCLLTLFLSRIFSFKRDKAVSYFISLHSTIPNTIFVYIKNILYLQFTRKTDKTLFICQNQRIYHNRKYFFKPALFDTIYNGVDIEYFKPGNIQGLCNLKASMNIPQNDKIILLVATIRPEKGHAYAIESLNILHTKHQDKKNTHLVFTGGGDENYISQLKQLVDNYSLQQFVHFEGNQKDVRKYLEISDLFTLTSFRVETFSIAALEAMCYGLPLSLTNIGGAAEMIMEGKNGLLTMAKDPDSIASSWATLLDACLDKKAIREIAVNNFSMEKCFQQYQQAISGN